MRRLHWSALGVAALTVGLAATATPTAAQTPTPIVSKSTWREKSFAVHLTDCPANAASRPGLQCALWVVIASKNREVENGVLLMKYPFLDVTKYRVRVVKGGGAYEAVYAGGGWETPPYQLSLRFGPDLSTATLAGNLAMRFLSPIGVETYKTLPISVKLTAVGPLSVYNDREHYWLGQCKNITFWNYSSRPARGTGRIGGVSLVTTDSIVFPDMPELGANAIFNFVDGGVQKGVCDATPTLIPA
jgi:hypothetical protein